MSQHLSDDGEEGRGADEAEYRLRAKLNSIINRKKFLTRCIEEKVLPRTSPPHLQSSDPPFTETARTYLEEACERLQYEATEIKSTLPSSHLPHALVIKLKEEDEKQRKKLDNKIQELCNRSNWKNAGRRDLISNFSSHTLTPTQEEALSLGLKFSTGLERRNFLDYALKNTRWNDQSIEKGIKQGIILCCAAAAAAQKPSIPKRYNVALEELRRNKNIIITSSDKGGGVVVMDKTEYEQKMNDLLNDSNTYVKQQTGQGLREAEAFNKKARKILSATTRGKKLLHLLEEAPRIPAMRGLPKTHKPGIPLRPITSGIGSAPHRLAKVLAKPLSSALGSISGTHLRNASDLKTQLENTDLNRKVLVSFDVKSLFTNVSVSGALEAVEKVLEKNSDECFPVNKSDYMKLVKLCVEYNSFSFNHSEYKQHEGLAMGSPLSAVMACLYIEKLESEHFLKTIPRNSKWLRYVDDVLVISSAKTDFQALLKRLNKINGNIQFTLEEENNGQLPFLDTVIIRDNNTVKFKVYRKPTNKDDLLHYYSAHDTRTKSGVLLGFFLRALRICSSDFLENEFEYITETFRKLKYPKGFIIKTKEKALDIHSAQKAKKKTKYILVPNSNIIPLINTFLKNTDTTLITSAGTKIRNLVKESNYTANENSLVYQIPCSGCDTSYFGETGRGLEIRLKEHKADMRHHRKTNALVCHAEEKDHLPEWKNVKILKKDITKEQRKAVEAAYITKNKNNINKRVGDVVWSDISAELVVDNPVITARGFRPGVR